MRTAWALLPPAGSPRLGSVPLGGLTGSPGPAGCLVHLPRPLRLKAKLEDPGEAILKDTVQARQWRAGLLAMWSLGFCGCSLSPQEPAARPRDSQETDPIGVADDPACNLQGRCLF